MQPNSNTKPKNWRKVESSTSTNMLQKVLHSIPIRFNKSSVLSSIPKVVLSSSWIGSKSSQNKPNPHPTHVVWWRSRHCGSANSAQEYAHAIPTRASQVVMTTLSRMESWAKIAIVGFVAICGFGLVNVNSCSALSSASLVIDGKEQSGVESSMKVVPGGTAYSAHTVQVKAEGIADYQLTIAGTTNLTGPSGATPITGASDGLEGSGSSSNKPGRIGSEMKDNTWGYGWDYLATNNEDMTYKSFSSVEEEITELREELDDSGKVDFTRKLVFAAKFGANNINSGNYHGSVNLSLVATPQTVTYTITYDTNDGSNNTSTILPTSCTIQGATSGNCNATITSTIPNKGPMWNFLGWADTTSATEASYTTGSTTSISGNKTVYAVWKYKPLTIIDKYDWGTTTMQDFTSAMCNKAPYGATNTLIDTRANNKYSYTITKMYDGKCWMTSNLQITGTIYATDSDFSSPASLSLPNSMDGFTDTDTNKYSLKSYDDTSKQTGYYNWYTATAQAGDESVGETSGVSVNTSICPKGWTLPTGGAASDKVQDQSDFSDLFATMDPALYSGGVFKSKANNNWATSGSIPTAVSDSPYNFTATGRITSNGSYYDTSNGFWWSSTVSSSDSAHDLYASTSNVLPGSSSYARYFGFAVRCVAR